MEVLKTRRDMEPQSVAYLAPGYTIHAELYNLVYAVYGVGNMISRILTAKGSPGPDDASIAVGLEGGQQIWLTVSYNMDATAYLRTNANKIVLNADCVSMFADNGVYAGNECVINLANVPCDFSRITQAGLMFANPLITTIIVPKSVSFPEIARDGYVFQDAGSLVGGAGTRWSASHIDGEYARIDNPPTAPGYFTAAT